MNQCPPGPQVFPLGRFEFFRKFAETFANECLSPVSLTLALKCSAVSTTPAKNLSPVSTTPAINSCHILSVLAGVVDTGDKFITGVVVTGDKFITGVVVTGDNDTSEQLSLVTTTPAIGDKNKDAMEVGSCQG
jgi:hypothetical protein